MEKRRADLHTEKEERTALLRPFSHASPCPTTTTTTIPGGWGKGDKSSSTTTCNIIRFVWWLHLYRSSLFETSQQTMQGNVLQQEEQHSVVVSSSGQWPVQHTAGDAASQRAKKERRTWALIRANYSREQSFIWPTQVWCLQPKRHTPKLFFSPPHTQPNPVRGTIIFNSIQRH